MPDTALCSVLIKRISYTDPHLLHSITKETSKEKQDLTTLLRLAFQDSGLLRLTKQRYDKKQTFIPPRPSQTFSALESHSITINQQPPKLDTPIPSLFVVFSHKISMSTAAERTRNKEETLHYIKSCFSIRSIHLL